MVTIQLVLDRETSARLAFLAEWQGQRKADVAVDLLTKAILKQYSESGGGSPPEISATAVSAKPTIPQVGRNQPVRYLGSDPRLESGKVYPSFADVLRLVRHDLARPWPDGKLYSKKAGGGDKAESILKRYEPAIYGGLSRVSNN